MSYQQMQDGKPHSVHSFLQSQDLEDLKESPLVGEKTSSFRDLLCFNAAITSITSCGFAPLFAPALCFCTGMYDGAYLQLTHEQIEFSQPTPSCCVLAKTKRTVRYENVTDTTLEDDCCLQLFGLKKLIVQTAGTGGTGEAALAGVQAAFLRDPDTFKLAIDHAVKLNKAMSAPAAQGMGRDAVPKAAQVQRAKLERINELAAAKVLTVAQAEELRVHALLAEENHVLQLAGMHQLVQQGMLTPQHLEAAVQAVLAKARK